MSRKVTKLTHILVIGVETSKLGELPKDDPSLFYKEYDGTRYVGFLVACKYAHEFQYERYRSKINEYKKKFKDRFGVDPDECLFTEGMIKLNVPYSSQVLEGKDYGEQSYGL